MLGTAVERRFCRSQKVTCCGWEMTVCCGGMAEAAEREPAGGLVVVRVSVGGGGMERRTLVLKAEVVQ